ncbi:MAG: beta-ketoacyl-ACP synthase III [Propionibacteriaceae bacterium]
MIHVDTPQRFSRLLSVGGYRPERVVTNADLIAMGLESTDDWIVQRTGIHERRWAQPHESVKYMATAAAQTALARAGLDPSSIDVVIVATVSHYKQTPALAPELAYELGATTAAAYDIGAGCAGFCYGVGQADALVRAGAAQHVLVIGAERLMDFINPLDRSTGFLFGDGAGAVVVGPSQHPGISKTIWGSDGSRCDVITNTATWQDAFATQEWPWITMDGQPVFRWATGTIAHRSHDILSAAGITPEELDVFIPHQANNRIIDSMLRHLHLPESVTVARDIAYLGNTSSASIPLAMESMLDKGEATAGQTALLVGFGAGLVYAGQVVELPDNTPADVPTPLINTCHEALRKDHS